MVLTFREYMIHGFIITASSADSSFLIVLYVKPVSPNLLHAV